MMKDPATMANLAEAVPPGSKIKLLFSNSSLYFAAETKCKLTLKVKRMQLVKAGTNVVEVADYAFEDYIYV